MNDEATEYKKHPLFTEEHINLIATKIKRTAPFHFPLTRADFVNWMISLFKADSSDFNEEQFLLMLKSSKNDKRIN